MGLNLYGQIGDGTYSKAHAPVEVPGLTDIVDVGGGYGHSVAVRQDGTVWQWRTWQSAEPRDDARVASSVPYQIESLSEFTNVAVGYSHTLGTLWGWGRNSMMQAGTMVKAKCPAKVGPLPVF